MKRLAAVVCVAASLTLLIGRSAVADNECIASSEAKVSTGSSLVIESKSIDRGQAFSVGIAITNDVALYDVQVMLVLREVDPGSYITSLSYPTAGRVSGARLNLQNGYLVGTKVANRYDIEDGDCKNGFPGGFKTTVPPSFTGPWSSPDGVKFLCGILDPSSDPPLPPGSDPATGSLQLLLTANNTPGRFEIDTTCCMPTCHTEFIDENSNSIIPQFTKGIITITPAPSGSVAVESKSVSVGSSTSVGIAVANTGTVYVIELPLVIREIDPGSYITSLSYPPSGRIPGGRLDLATGALHGIKIANRYNVEDGNCKNGSPGGFQTILSPSYTGPWSSPDAVRFVCAVLDPTDPTDPPLSAGADPVTGSLQLLLTVNDTPGRFEIDTTCCTPASHLEFIDEFSVSLLPLFTKGTVTIVTCDCPSQGDMDNSGAFDAGDVLEVIKVAFINGTDVMDPGCPRTRADVNNSGAVDVQDVLYMIATTFLNGPNPINPCGP